MGEAPRPADAVKALEAEIRRHNRLYWDSHSPEITDYEYDALVRQLTALAPDSPVLTEMGPSAPGGDASRAGAEFRHKERMLSLDKCYAAEDLEAWAGTFEGDVVVTPKFDGIACALHYDAGGRLAVAATRGDGEVGEDITANAREIKDIPGRVRSGGRAIEVRGEIYMRLSVFARFQAEGKSNPRNLAAGAIKQKDVKRSAAYELSFAAYDLLGVDEATQEGELSRLVRLGFPKVDYRVLPRHDVLRGYEEFARLRPTLDYEIDGVVFKANDLGEQRRLGETSHHPRHSLAFKFQGDSGISTLREVEWSVARSGAITPVAIVEPVALSGVSVSRASLHNVAFIGKLGLTLGAKVTLVRRGGVIPNVEGVVEPGTGPVVVPTRCPSCNKPVVREKDFLYCTEPRTCRSAVIGRLAHFTATCDILGFGDVILEQCYDAGLLRSPADFYRLTWQPLAGLERSGEKMGRKLVAEVDRKRTLDLATFLRALGVADLGKHVSTLLAERYATLDRVLAATEEELVGTHGIGETIAHSVVAGLALERASIDALREHVTVTEARSEAAGDKPFAGKSFVFTGKLSTLARSEAEQRVRALGGAVLSAVSKSVAYLVLGQEKDGGKSTKQKAAEKLVAAGEAIKVLSEGELIAMLEVVEGGVGAGGGAGAGAGAGAGDARRKAGQGQLFGWDDRRT
jgi:DNA ligase (NAD+)